MVSFFFPALVSPYNAHTYFHTLAGPPASVPGFDVVEEQVAVIMAGDSGDDGENGGMLTVHMNNTITVGGFQWILRCKGMWGLKA